MTAPDPTRAETDGLAARLTASVLRHGHVEWDERDAKNVADAALDVFAAWLESDEVTNLAWATLADVVGRGSQANAVLAALAGLVRRES